MARTKQAPVLKEPVAVETDGDAGEGASSSAVAVAERATTTAKQATRAQRRSKLPAPVQFPLVAILSFSISSLGYSFLNEYTSGELATITRTLGSPREVAVMAGWRLCELALGWFSNWDSFDLAALNLLSHSPPLYLLTTFYGLKPTTAFAGLFIDVLASFLPFLLLRPLSGAHRAAPSVPNREIIADRPIQIITTLLAGVTYSVTLFFACKTYLPRALVLHFAGIPTVEPATTAATILVSPTAAALALASGLAARSFIFEPLAATGRTEADEANDRFDAARASLGQTFWWNVWGYRAQTKVGLARTAVAVAVVGANTFLQCAMTVGGVEAAGAAVYASVWMLAACLTGIALGIVGDN